MGSSKRKYRFHLLGLVHLPCSKIYMACAFTQKNYKLARMLLSLGHEIYYYGSEGPDMPCTKFIQTHTLSDIRNNYGNGDGQFEIGYDRIIPNSFDPEDIEFSSKKEDYYLFIGRMMKRKGILIAYLATQAIGKKLLIAGQGAHIDYKGYRNFRASRADTNLHSVVQILCG